MARARNIKPGFYKNEDLAECSVWARLLFPGLWMLADREGRIEDRPKRIKGEIFPFDAVEVDPLLEELSKWGFIRRYVADGKRCIQINNFSAHQSPHATEKDSDLPDENGAYTVNERAKNGCITGKNSQIKSKSNQTTVNPPLNNSETTVNPPSDNALNPESLNPDSLIPSEANASVGKPTLSPDEIIFGYGVPILTNAGTAEKLARSFLGGLRKAHGDDALVNTLRECIRAKPLQPLEWLAKAMLPDATGSPVETRYQKSKREQMERDFPNLTNPKNEKNHGLALTVDR